MKTLYYILKLFYLYKHDLILYNIINREKDEHFEYLRITQNNPKNFENYIV